MLNLDAYNVSGPKKKLYEEAFELLQFTYNEIKSPLQSIEDRFLYSIMRLECCKIGGWDDAASLIIEILELIGAAETMGELDLGRVEEAGFSF